MFRARCCASCRSFRLVLHVIVYGDVESGWKWSFWVSSYEVVFSAVSWKSVENFLVGLPDPICQECGSCGRRWAVHDGDVGRHASAHLLAGRGVDVLGVLVDDDQSCCKGGW